MLQGLHLKLLINDSLSRIFNVDEVGFPLSGRAKSLLVKRGMKSPQSFIPGSGRENITVQVFFLPYVFYTGQRLQYNCTRGGSLGTCYSVSPNEWMTGPTFLDWIKSLFLLHSLANIHQCSFSMDTSPTFHMKRDFWLEKIHVTSIYLDFLHI